MWGGCIKAKEFFESSYPVLSSVQHMDGLCETQTIMVPR